MEYPSQEHREDGPTPEREPQVGDVVAAFRHVVSELVPEVTGGELDDLVSEIEDSTDTEDALGAAAGAFVMAGVDYDEGLARLGEILQVESIRSNGSEAQK